ncbi:MAG: PAS domain S-box protein [Proteobacteria bacterium]|nr:PAS domain S-box protein [Pseudomonadota bacterium]
MKISGNRLLLLSSIMAAVAFCVTGIAMLMLYAVSFEQAEQRLLETARSHARLIEAVARYDRQTTPEDLEGATRATILQIRDGLGPMHGTVEITVARRRGGDIVFLLQQRSEERFEPAPVLFDSPTAEPMRRALLGRTGTVVGLDYRDETVLAAHVPVPVLDLGIVVKMDLAEVRAPFVRAGLIVTAIAIAVVLLGTALFLRVGEPMIRRLRISETRYKTLFENAGVSIWNQDFSGVGRELERLRGDGVTDLRQYLEANKDAAWAMAASIKVTEVNEATLKLFGAETEQVFIESIDNVFWPGAINVFIDEVCAIWESKAKIFQSEATQKTLSGEELTVILSMPIPVTEEDFRSVPVSIIDITERKRLEEAVRRREERFRSAFENVPVGNLVIGETGSIEVFNAAAEKIFGYTSDEVIGRNVNLLIPERYRGRHDSHIRNHLETGDGKSLSIDCEVTGLRKNSEEFPIHLGVGEIREGGRRSFIATFTDLTEIKALEVRLRQAQRMEAVGQLTGGIAHDFNNLLAVMLGNAELLELRAGASEESHRHIEEIKGAVLRGASLTQRLLAFSRQQVLSPVSADVSSLIDGLRDMLRRALGEAIDLRVDGAPDLWPVTIDPHQFENALINLAVNARDAMPDGGTLVIEAANVTLDETYAESHEEVTQGDYVKVAVSDVGAGMPGTCWSMRSSRSSPPRTPARAAVSA